MFKKMHICLVGFFVFGLSALSLHGMENSEVDDIFHTFFGNGRLRANINEAQNTHEASVAQAVRQDNLIIEEQVVAQEPNKIDARYDALDAKIHAMTIASQECPVKIIDRDHTTIATAFAQIDDLNQRLEIAERKEEQLTERIAAQEQRIKKLNDDLESVSRTARGY